MNTAHIITLISAGQLAVDLWRAEFAAAEAKAAYYRRIDLYESKHGALEKRIDPREPAHAKAIAFTKDRYDAHEASKRKLYNIRRRLRNACQKAARLAAESTGGAR